MNFEAIQAKLAHYNQQHLLQFWNDLSQDEQKSLARQIDDIDFEMLSVLIAGKDDKIDFETLASTAESPPSVRADGSGAAWTAAEAKQRGEEALRAGEVGAILVAGGQGTRLGFDLPKGMFPVGPVSNRTLFQIFADRLLAIGNAYGSAIPFYIMTSDATDAATREYFAENNYLGMSQDDVIIFRQGTMPAVDAESGHVLMASTSSLALSPDGHGGTVRALERNGCLADAKKRGLKQLSYFQVDNPLVNVCDPTLIGHHLLSGSEMTTQVIRKRFAMEKVGNIALAGGVVQVIEYSDLPKSAAERVDENGQLILWAGSIGVHVIDVDFLVDASENASALPFHRALKKVPYVDAHKNLISPAQPNAVKFEKFIFDLLPSAKNAFVVEVLPSEGFAPVKNADGAENDTPKLAREAMVSQHRRWLEAAGATVAEGVQVEINPQFSLTPEQLAEKIPPNLSIEADRYFEA